jgi:DUF1365 family protein
MLEIDLDRIEEAGRLCHLFSVNRGNAISFWPADCGAQRASASLRLWAEARYGEAGIRLEGGEIRLITFPRVLGFGFAPISLWFGHGPDGRVRGVIYEVHNTFGESHSYVSACDPADARGRAEKAFHVSPLIADSGDYRFTLRRRAERLALIVENLGADGRIHVASLHARSLPITDRSILGWLVTLPLSGVGVVFAIHWQALRLWLKGAPYYAKPKQCAKTTTLVAADRAGAQDLRKRA